MVLCSGPHILARPEHMAAYRQNRELSQLVRITPEPQAILVQSGSIANALLFVELPQSLLVLGAAP